MVFQLGQPELVKTPTMADGMRKSRLEGVRDLLNMTWTVGAGARMHHWLDLLPDQAFSPSAGAGGGGGGACPGEAVKPSSCRQPGRARQLAPTALAPQGLAGGAQTHLGMPVGGIFACCVLPGGVLAPVASSHG